jgi:predicted DCC family thiol-disulfide oxidoreductase YuxK
VNEHTISATQSSRGVILYDGQCGFCSRWVRCWASTLGRRGFAIASLDEPWVAKKINEKINKQINEQTKMSREELLTDIRLITAEGQLISGADVYLYVTQKIWWAWPFYAIFSLPGFNRLIHLAYRWFARNRHHISHACHIQTR